jgi:polar amino acid transport system substrate-binding protein
LFKWIGPIGAIDWVLYTRLDNRRKISHIEEVRGEVIGGVQQDVISTWLTGHGYQVDPVSDDKLNLEKLLKGRFNYWATAKARAVTMLQKEGLTTQVVPVLTFGRTDLYLACHLSTEPALVNKLNDALRKMHADGTTARIEARNAN